MSHQEFGNISFDLPKNQSNVIKVIGVGGGGSNAINHMFSQGIKGVDFVICNTDAQALENSTVPVKIQLGVTLTEGLGAGANPKIGEQAAVESVEEIRAMLATNTKMIFITAGMGGGTGTGAAPIIAQMARELDILTVGIVTMPFQFEGKLRNDQAQIGIENLRKNVDSLIVVNNNKLREVYGNLGFKAGFSKADEVLATAARGIAEVITHHYTQNIDLRDAKTVLANSGTAIMGSANAIGSNRAKDAISKALDSPLLNDNKIKGAKNVLLLIVSGTEEITIDEIGEISDYIQEEAGHSANIIMGVGEDQSLEGAISITVIATGFDPEQQNHIVHTEAKRIIHTLEEEQRAAVELSTEDMPQGHLPKEPINTGPTNHAQIESIDQADADQGPVIRHTLFEEEEVEPAYESTLVEAEGQDGPELLNEPFEDYIETTELIRNINVTAEVVDINYLAEFQQVSVNEIEVHDFEIVSVDEQVNEETLETSDQMSAHDSQDQMLMFDLPINQQSSDHIMNLEVEVEEVEAESGVADEIEAEESDALDLSPAEPQITAEQTPIRHVLDDEFIAQEQPEVTLEESPAAEEEMTLKTKTQPEKTPAESTESMDPLNTPIAQLLRERAEERKRKMKEFNYKFRNSAAKIDEIERQPAYKRMGIELEDTNDVHEEQISRTTVNLDDDELDLRSNNSFLHDNVD
ncbi:MAG: cell division protein FtsZ [Flavobacteriaceae bacterium]